jgi:hypothetical protein
MYPYFFNLLNINIMSNQNETGNAKNVANLQKLIEQVSVYTGKNLMIFYLITNPCLFIFDK